MSQPTVMDRPDFAPLDSTGVLQKGALSAVVILTALNFICLYDRVQISALAQPIKEAFGWSDTQIGLITGTAFGLTFAAAAIPLAWLSDRSSRTRLLAAVVTFWSLMTAGSSFAQSFWQMFAARVGVAAGESAFTPTAHSLLGDYYPAHRRGWAIGIETSGATLGIMAGMAAAGVLGSLYGWRTALLIAGVPGLMLAVITLLWMKEPQRTHAAPVAKGPKVPLLRRVNSAYGWLVIAAICNSTMSTGWTHWLPSFFMRTHDVSLAVVGASVGVASGLGLTLGAFAGAWVSHAAAARGANVPFKWCAVISLLVLPGYALAIWAPHPTLGFIGVFMSTLVAGMLPPFIFGGIQNSCDPGFRARAVAFALAFVTIGSYAVAPVVIGTLSDWFLPAYGQDSLRMALNAFLLVPLIAAAVFVRISRTFVVWA